MAQDQALAANFLRLAKAPENERFRSWLKTERERWRDMLETTRDPALVCVAQGRAQMIKDIQAAMDTAANTK